MSGPRFLLPLLAMAALAGCGRAEPESAAGSIPEELPEPPATELRSQDEAGPPLVVFLGDSLTAGFGLPADEAFPALLAADLAESGHPIRFVNAGISGDTSAGGLQRVDWLLRSEPDVVVVALGANDGLRGLDLEMTERNLREILQRVRDAGARALLAGILVPTNYGAEFAGRFREMYPRLAEEAGVPLIPFLLEGVAGIPELNLPDGIHPNAEGYRRVADTVRDPLLALLTKDETDG